MSNALARMCEEDSTLRLENNLETKQTILYGVGDQHLDVILNKLKSKYKVEVRLKLQRFHIEKRFVKLPLEKVDIKNNLLDMDSLVMYL